MRIYVNGWIGIVIARRGVVYTSDLLDEEMKLFISRVSQVVWNIVGYALDSY